MTEREDPYARVHYRHLIAWPQRIRREGPLLERVLAKGPSRRVLDLGSGPGDHARFLASREFDVVGVDASESMMEMAHEEPVPSNVQFVLGDFRELPAVVEGRFGGAICLGNALPHLTEESDVRAMARGLAEVLLPGARFLLQILNYERFAATGERALPVNVSPNPEGHGELVFVRVMTVREDGSVLFFPTTLRLVPDADPPLEVVHSRRVELRAWRRSELRDIFSEAGIEEEEALGGFDGSPFDAAVSRDLIWIGRRN